MSVDNENHFYFPHNILFLALLLFLTLLLFLSSSLFFSSSLLQPSRHHMLLHAPPLHRHAAQVRHHVTPFFLHSQLAQASKRNANMRRHVHTQANREPRATQSMDTNVAGTSPGLSFLTITTSRCVTHLQMGAGAPHFHRRGTQMRRATGTFPLFLFLHSPPPFPDHCMHTALPLCDTTMWPRPPPWR